MLALPIPPPRGSQDCFLPHLSPAAAAPCWWKPRPAIGSWPGHPLTPLPRVPCPLCGEASRVGDGSGLETQQAGLAPADGSELVDSPLLWVQDPRVRCALCDCWSPSPRAFELPTHMSLDVSCLGCTFVRGTKLWTSCAGCLLNVASNGFSVAGPWGPH